ncbi:MAG: P22 phage major capsid protein family protein [Thermoleophilaceae bacterium]
MALVTRDIVSLAVELLARMLVLPQTALRVPGTDYHGSGGTAIVRVPQRLTANQQVVGGDPISFDSLDETEIAVVLEHWYSAVKITDEELTLDVRDFANQVLAPMIAAVAAAGEDRLAAVINGLAATSSFALAEDPEDTKDVILAARETLVDNDVPAAGRYLAVSPQIASRLFKVDTFVKVNESGSPDALRNATLGSIYGLQVVESSALTDGEAAVYHRSALAFATLAPAVPSGAASARAQAVQGIALRVLQDFDASVLSDVIAVNTFGGAELVDGDRIVKLDTAVA